MDKVPSVSKDDGDAEILAVRSLIAQTSVSQKDTRSKSSETDEVRASKKVRLPRVDPVEQPHAASERPAAITEYLKTCTKELSAALWSRIRAYRPHRGSVLLTSLVLLLILQPAFVLGWALLGLAIVLGCYFAMGSDAFWRRILAVFATWQRLHPVSARRFKVRAYVFSRKWDKLIAKLPERVARNAQLPDLRNLMAADKRHDAALNDRLSRLQ